MLAFPINWWMLCAEHLSVFSSEMAASLWNEYHGWGLSHIVTLNRYPASRLHRGPPGWAAMALIIRSDGVVVLMMESNSGSVRNGGTWIFNAALFRYSLVLHYMHATPALLASKSSFFNIVAILTSSQSKMVSLMSWIFRILPAIFVPPFVIFTLAYCSVGYAGEWFGGSASVHL